MAVGEAEVGRGPAGEGVRGGLTPAGVPTAAVVGRPVRAAAGSLGCVAGGCETTPGATCEVGQTATQSGRAWVQLISSSQRVW